jgi:ClpP class serine protease
LLKVSGRTGEINVHGVLTNEPDWIAQFFLGGNTTYPDIISALRDADADPEVDSISLRIGSSPGGEFEGLIPAMDAIAGTAKPTSVTVDGMAASAAYMLASQGNPVTAANDGTLIGSVGVVQTHVVDEHFVDVTNRESPNKRLDITTEEGKAAAQDELDGIYNVVADRIAAGRGVERAKVDKDFGRGAMMLAGAARDAGLIDSIGTETTAAKPGGKEKAMNLEEFKAQHPDLYKAVFEAGVNDERDRVTAHVEMGQASGDVDYALEAIKTGADLTRSAQAHYMAAGMALSVVGDHTPEENDVISAVQGVLR